MAGAASGGPDRHGGGVELAFPVFLDAFHQPDPLSGGKFSDTGGNLGGYAGARGADPAGSGMVLPRFLSETAPAEPGAVSVAGSGSGAAAVAGILFQSAAAGSGGRNRILPARRGVSAGELPPVAPFAAALRSCAGRAGIRRRGLVVFRNPVPRLRQIFPFLQRLGGVFGKLPAACFRRKPLLE